MVNRSSGLKIDYGVPNLGNQARRNRTCLFSFLVTFCLDFACIIRIEQESSIFIRKLFTSQNPILDWATPRQMCHAEFSKPEAFDHVRSSTVAHTQSQVKSGPHSDRYHSSSKIGTRGYFVIIDVKVRLMLLYI